MVYRNYGKFLDERVRPRCGQYIDKIALLIYNYSEVGNRLPVSRRESDLNKKEIQP
jgi:hypothetical protein